MFGVKHKLQRLLPVRKGKCGAERVHQKTTYLDLKSVPAGPEDPLPLMVGGSSSTRAAALWTHRTRSAKEKDLNALQTDGRGFRYQADFDPVHHEFEDVSLEALYAGGRQTEWGRGVRDRRRTAVVVRLVAGIWGERLMVRRVRDVQQVKQVLTHI